MNAGDLEKLGKQIAEAQALIGKRDAIQHEIAKAQKDRERLLEEIAKTEAGLETARSNLAASQERFNHETARYTTQLERTVAECATQEESARRQADARMKAADADARRAEQLALAQRGELDNALRALRDEYSILEREVLNFKARIAAL